MSVANIKSAMSSAITNAFSNISCYTSIPSVTSPTVSKPSVIIRTGDGNYLINMPLGKVERTFYVDLIVQKGGTIEDAQIALDTYLMPTTNTSMKVAIMATNTSTNADWVRVQSDTGLIALQYGDVTYMGCTWTVKAMI
jgi:hypothetical protein